MKQTFEQWLAEFRRIGREKYGIENVDKYGDDEDWREYFLDECTPEETWEIEWSYA